MDKQLVAVATQLFCTINTPRSLSCLILMRYGEWDQLATMAVDPLTYLDTVTGAHRYYLDTSASAFLRKSPLLETSWDRKQRALDIFERCEQQCCETNYLLQLYELLPPGESRMAERLLEILSKARKIASRILGPLPDSVELGFGPGTCFELKGSTYHTLADKVWITPTTTPECRDVFELLYTGTFWCKSRQEAGLPHSSVSRGNRFTTVPKDGKTDRGICIEPLGNLAVQLGIGRYLKRRLSHVGLKVNSFGKVSPAKWAVAQDDGQKIHRRLARDGSSDSSWATIDLSNASDTIALELVKRVIPPDWYSLLHACRSPFSLVGKRWVRLEKFSSMGNGFTFELETLLFACILAAGCNVSIGDTLFVYGDDILLPNDKYSEAVAILKACGFTPNLLKSYSTGPFRESCGGDYFLGYDVRPLFCKSSMSGPLDWVTLHNSLKWRFPYRNRLILERCVSPIPAKLRVYGPRRLGDMVLHSTVYPVSVSSHIHWVKGIVAVPKKVQLDRYGSDLLYLLAVLGCDSGGIAVRGEPSGYRLVRVSAS